MNAKTSARPIDRDTSGITIGNRAAELPVMHGSIGPSVIDIADLYKETGAFTYDPGFTSTASCESKITYIDGDEGVRSIAAIPSSRSPSTAISSKLATCSSTVSSPPRARRLISTTASRATPWCMSR